THAAVAATCTTAGNSAYYSCDRCNKYFSDSEGNTEIEADSWVISATGHNMTTHAAVAATCTTAGNSVYYSCDRCNKFFSDSEGNTEIANGSWVIAATGHNMTTHAAVAATCTTAGNSAYYSCDRCNKFFSDAEGNTEIAENSWVIGALGHNMTPHAANAATCTAAGNSAYWSCDRCNKFFSDAEGETEIAENSWVIPATGHTEETIPAVAATCTTAGATAGVKCSVCDTILTAPEVIPALGHDYQYEHISPSSPAQHIVTCSRCDYETTELCDTAGDEGACSKCGYLDAEIVAVEDDTLVFMTPSPSYMSTGIQINFRVRNTVLSKYADMEVVVIPDKYDMTTLNRVANPSEIVTRKSALASAGSAAKQYTYTDITLYELGLNVNYMLRAYDASGNFVAYSPVYSTSVEAYLRQQISSTSDANAKRMYIDTLVVCDEVMKNVAANHAGSDLATDYATHRVVDDIDLTQGSTSISECNTVDDLTSYSVQFTKESTAVHQVRTSVTVEKVPYITLRIKDQSQGLDLSKLAITVTYTSVDKAGSHPYSRTFTGSDFTRVGSNRFIEMKFAEVGLHDSNKTITFACSYDGVDMFELDYSLETYESANISNATTGDMLSALIKLGQSFRTYQGLD
ncbi:MAG: hypothetical protein IKN26_06505, partial [Eubacterium sp.]|nr:hypothetical protein [Eubacterium sp.]